MAITLFLEQPIGTKTTKWEFTPEAGIRFTGKVTGIFGWPQPSLQVRVELLGPAGNTLSTWLTTTNIVGNYWIDTRTPQKTGFYAVTAGVKFLAGEEEAVPVTFSVTLLPAGIGPEIEVDVSPVQVAPGNMVKASCAVRLDSKLESGVPVEFRVFDPVGSLTVDVNKITDAQGQAWITFSPQAVGAWQFVISVPKYGMSKSSLVTVAVAAVPDEPTPTPKPDLTKWLAPVGLGVLAVALLTRRR